MRTKIAVSKAREILKVLIFACFFVTLASIVSYVKKVNAMTSDIYSLQEKQEKVSLISTENEKLEIELSKKSSFDSAEELVAGRSFEKVGSIRYLQVLDGQVAVK